MGKGVIDGLAQAGVICAIFDSFRQLPSSPPCMDVGMPLLAKVVADLHARATALLEQSNNAAME